MMQFSIAHAWQVKQQKRAIYWRTQKGIACASLVRAAPQLASFTITALLLLLPTVLMTHVAAAHCISCQRPAALATSSEKQ
jgi:hypothetical protein